MCSSESAVAMWRTTKTTVKDVPGVPCGRASGRLAGRRTSSTGHTRESKNARSGVADQASQHARNRIPKTRLRARPDEPENRDRRGHMGRSSLGIISLLTPECVNAAFGHGELRRFGLLNDLANAVFGRLLALNQIQHAAPEYLPNASTSDRTGGFPGGTSRRLEKHLPAPFAGR